MYLIIPVIVTFTAMVTARPTENNRDQNAKALATRDLTGDLTHYGTGLGACGVVSTEADYIVSISHFTYDASYVGSNPNLSPLCGKQIQASIGSNTAVLTVVDRCTGCQPADIDVSDAVFSALAGNLNLGRVPVTWNWID